MKPLASLALGAVLTMTSAAATAAVPEPPAGTAATFYTPPVNTPAIIPVEAPGYRCESDSPTAPLRATPCPPWDRPIPPAVVTGYKIPGPEIGDAVVAYPGPDGTIVTVTIGGSARRFLL